MSTTTSSRPPQRKKPHKHNKQKKHLRNADDDFHLTKSTAALNKKIRDLNRLLSRPQSDRNALPADVRVERERALEAYKQDLKTLKDAARTRKMALRYKHVRFFEQKKASRRLKQAERALQDADDDPQKRDHLMKMVHNAKADLNYTLHFPLTEKYISLYRESGADANVIKKKGTIWRDIAQKMGESALGVAKRIISEPHTPQNAQGSKLMELREAAIGKST